MIPSFPDIAEVHPDQRFVLHPRFRELPEGISEFSFAGIYLFRELHQYRLSRLPDENLLLIGNDQLLRGEDHPFFLLPFGLPEDNLLEVLFEKYGYLKLVSESMADQLQAKGYEVQEQRNYFDYLYLREELAQLTGRRFHRKKNLVNSFLRNYRSEGRPLLEEYMPHALEVLESWRKEREDPGDYLAAREALERMEELQLCGGIFYVDQKPIAYTLGEELAQGRAFVIHFEKAAKADHYRGIYQYMNQFFASLLPAKYSLINREQDLGDPGLRQAKESYNPAGFVRKYCARKPI